VHLNYIVPPAFVYLTAILLVFSKDYHARLRTILRLRNYLVTVHEVLPCSVDPVFGVFDDERATGQINIASPDACDLRTAKAAAEHEPEDDRDDDMA
jgi:hypothetical protein